MRNWALWLIHHRMTWLLKAIVIVSYPVILLSYWDDALDDVRYTMRSIDLEKKK